MALTTKTIIMPIEEWETRSLENKSLFLKNNRLYLQKYERVKLQITHVVFQAFEDTVIIK
jgi:predicted phosphohydrolase